jgi:murein DD-endopeptidase MepM/ murein hydrolase activator NlpD
VNVTYTVKPRDTLDGIAKSYDCSVQELQSLNGIDNPRRLQIGQLLRIPKSSQATGTTSASAASTDQTWSSTILRFIDAVGRPIKDLGVRLVSSEGNEVTARTDANGCVSALACTKPEAKIDIHVERAKHKGGGEKQIGSYTPMAGQQTVKVQSGKQVETTKIRRHDGQPQTPPRTMKNELPGTKIETATPQGNPLTCIKCGECPNDDDLLLGANLEFRDHVKTAAKRAAVLPQAVAAVMNAEAAKDKAGKWKADSKSDKSSATGMTQFLDGTWVGEALRAGTFLNEKAVKEGWLSKDAKGQLQFKKADGTFVTSPGLTSKLTAKTMIPSARTAQDKNLQKLLNLREQAEYAIMAAMDYAKYNLDCLTAKGYDIASLNDTEKARIMYLCHHLGIGDAVHFIQNTIPEEDIYAEDKKGKKRLKQNGAKKLLTAQIGEKKAEKNYVTPKGGSWVKGHRAWLSEFIEGHIVPHTFACPGKKQESFKDEERAAKLESTTDDLKK